MAKATKNPLDLLNLSGLAKLEKKPQASGTRGAKSTAFAAKAPTPNLGALSELPGTWTGTGFNLIELPNMNQAKPGPPPTDKFKVMLNNTAETLVFSDIDGEIINRGNAQSDIAYLGLHYLQSVSDVNLPKGENGIHLETGLFLNLPSGTDPNVQPSIARLGSIPHGDSLLAQGTFFTVPGGPQFGTPPVPPFPPVLPPILPIADPTPFTIVNGKRVNDTSETYLSLLKNAIPPKGIPKDAIMDPNSILRNAIVGQNIIETTVIFLDANPIEGVCNPNAIKNAGGITNIPFINVNANANSLTAIFWIEKILNKDNSITWQLQYTQTVILDFPVFGAPPKSDVTPIKWPHISVATLIRS